ncbi:alpha/beta fold hydrolase [Aquisalimonas sp.]|uniref:alpha/beta fold hydrolase n=1 Tax=Aquisalimonas sp. TaxID=1872621 RepID=UPI0025BF1624|nr:alpha/beta fold hydrolase [Aquisalimonas sp.]
MKKSWWRRRWLWIALVAPVIIWLLSVTVWTWWAEEHPSQERELRVQLHELLQEQFPEQMRLPDHRLGFIPRGGEGRGDRHPDVILIHGLDEPGDIWDDMAPALREEGMEPWEFRYPNDHAIDRSVDLLAERWAELPGEQPVVLVGHSMGGLVIRDFVSRVRHPVEGEPAVEGPPVRGTILLGTPNHGSELARLRVWLGLRELVAQTQEEDFSPFAPLRSGTGAAKIDLRPGSQFLTKLNERPWPEGIPLRLIGGMLGEPDPDLLDAVGGIAAELGTQEMPRQFEHWWRKLGEGVGDGVVPVSSLSLADAPPPTLVPASHRGMLVRSSSDEERPPAIPHVLDILAEWEHP